MRSVLIALALVGCAPPSSEVPPTTLAPIDTCAPGDPCAAAPDGRTVAGYRKDVFYPYGPGLPQEDPSVAFGTDDAPAYPEARLADPVDGGRIVVVTTAAVGGRLVPGVAREETIGDRGRLAWQVEVDGAPLHEAIDAGAVDWLRVWPTTFEAGDPLWVQLHAADPALDVTGELSLRVPVEGGGFALDATVSLAPTPLRLESVAHDEDGATMWVHVRNTDARPHRLQALLVDGVDVTDVACPAVDTLAPGDAVAVQVPLCAPVALGDAWTVAALWEDAPPSVGAGRVLPPRFPVHTWPSGDDCALPSVNDAALDRHRDAAFDTLFVRTRYDGPECADVPTVDLFPAAFEDAGVWAMLDEWTPMPADRGRVAARMLGDEVDTGSLEAHIASQKMRRLAEESAWMHEQAPEVPTYIGGSRHRLTGRFAGVADLQGMDFYAAACAPHITDFGASPPLRGPYDYLRATVLNHAPGVTWLYAQGLHGGWPAQPTADDVTHAALSVLAAGGHGLMWFQSTLALADAHPATWDAMADANRIAAALGPWLRRGAATGLARTDARAIVEALRVPDGLVLVVLSLETSAGPEELPCALGSYTPWAFAPITAGVDVVVPDAIGVDRALEVTPEGLTPFPLGAIDPDTRTVSLEVPLGPGQVGRVVLLTADDALVEGVAARFGDGDAPAPPP